MSLQICRYILVSEPQNVYPVTSFSCKLIDLQAHDSHAQYVQHAGLQLLSERFVRHHFHQHVQFEIYQALLLSASQQNKSNINLSLSLSHTHTHTHTNT